MRDMKLQGSFVIEIIRDGITIEKFDGKNLIPDAALNAILNTMFNAATNGSSWFIGLIDNASFSAIANSDILSSHTGWIENNSYSGSRPAWTQGSATSRTIANSSVVTFTMTGTATIKGIFVTNAATGTSGLLWAAGAFGSTQSVVGSDQIKVTYQIAG